MNKHGRTRCEALENKKAKDRALRTQEREEDLAGRCRAAHRALSPCTRTSHGVCKAAIHTQALAGRHVMKPPSRARPTRHYGVSGGCGGRHAQALALVHCVPLLCARLRLGRLTRPVAGLSLVSTGLSLFSQAHPRRVRLPRLFQLVLFTVEEGGSAAGLALVNWRAGRYVDHI